MRDIVVLIFLIGCIIATLRQAWLGVLGLAIFSYMNPHSFTWGFMRHSVPAYEILFFAVLVTLFSTRDRQPTPKDWRVTTFFLLWFYFFITTTVALVRAEAWAKFIEVSKIYLPMLLTLWLINTRRKLYYLIITIAASIGLVAVKGGIWAILSGFHYRVYGPAGTQFYENNAFAVATNMAIPLIILWLRETQSQRLRRILTAAIPLCMASSLSSWSRGGLLSLAVTTLFLIWNSKRKYLAVPLLVIGLLLVTRYLPEEWFARMHTIQTYQQDASAEGRLRAWRDGVQWALDHPFTGAGFEGWREVTMRDWHSSYVEIMAEHGLIAFAMWFSLLFGTLISLTRLPHLTRQVPEMAWVENYSLMLRASLVAYATGTIFLGLSYWDIFYHIVFIAALTKKFALQQLASHSEETSVPGGRQQLSLQPVTVPTQPAQPG